MRNGITRRLSLRLAMISAFSWSPAGNAETALVAVATNFVEVAESLVQDFENLSEHKIEISSASTGKLYAQIVNAAPFDALLAADQEYARRLEQSGDAVADTRFVYAIGKLTLWSPDERRISGNGIEILKRQEFRALAVANPALAPYGAAAMQTLRALGLWEALQPRIVSGENVGQAFALVATGNAELGFVALASVLSARNNRAGSRWDVPEHFHSPIRQDAVLLRHGEENAAAVGFLAYLRSDEARLTIVSFGYGLE